MEQILAKARSYELYAARKSDSYYFAARAFRMWHLLLGGTSAVIGAAVGTAVLSAVIKGDAPFLSAMSPAAKPIAQLLVVGLAVLSPSLTSLQTFLQSSDSAAACRSAAGKYNVLRQRVSMFLLRYGTDSNADREAAMLALDAISDEFGRLAENTPAIRDRFWDRTRGVRIDEFNLPQVERKTA